MESSLPLLDKIIYGVCATLAFLMVAIAGAGRNRLKHKPLTPEQTIELQKALAAQGYTKESHAKAWEEARVKLPILIGVICGLIVFMLTDRALNDFSDRPLLQTGLRAGLAGLASVTVIALLKAARGPFARWFAPLQVELRSEKED